LAIGLKKHNPEMTKDYILDISPPFVPMVQALDKALYVSYFGAEAPKETQPEAEDTKKKTE
jgi:hypothetical protein